MSGLQIAIVGMRCRVPGASDLDTLWANLERGIETITRLDDADLLRAQVPAPLLELPTYVKARGILPDVEGFDAELFGLSPREAEILDPQQRLLLELAWEALEAAGYAPRSTPESIAVFAGSGPSTYFLRNVFPSLDRLGAVGLSQLQIGNDKDYLATQISYRLGLRGPSVSVQTACSTSLVAVHLACQALLGGECDLALAGGVNVQVPQHSGYLYEEDGILSPDGHCRAFDTAARGCVSSNGAAIVVLKRLDDALRDGDRIHAVILGSAMNNDGADKVGFTAPSVSGQRDVIRAAHRVAEVDPASIGYVEAHGTGTRLGDPIEVAALNAAFAGAGRAHRCALGSLKSNLGHLDAAAGVAGLIKAALALRHGVIPPSLHFVAPSPLIDFAAGPFEVPRTARPFTGPLPRRAGVSSFGIGGTNAHVIVEEPPPAAEDAPAARPAELLVLSAQTSTALAAQAERLADHLRDRPALALADVAFTLAVGRHPLPHRTFVVASDPAEAAAALRGEAARAHASRVARERPAVVFLFSGQGAQVPGMARELYAAEPVFRDVIDRGAAELGHRHGVELLPLLLGDPADPELAARLADTRVTQPALFLVELALARLWMSIGVSPTAMLGHSIGEYVAACLAEVFSFEAALALVAARGRLLQELPRGAMLAVALPEAALRERLPAEVSIAAVNAPARCVISGPTPAIEALERALAESQLATRRLRTSHAFHSAMMEPAMSELARLAGACAPQPPRLPYFSNVTGALITAEQATDPAYYGRQLRDAVRFSESIGRVLEAAAAAALLEVGPGSALVSLARAHPALTPAHRTVASLPQPGGPRSGVHGFLEAVGQLWTLGVPIDARRLHGAAQRRRVELPTYPFERRRFWIDPPAAAPRDAGPAPAAPGTPPAPAPAPAGAAPAPAAPGARHPRPPLATPFVAPRTDAEHAIAECWSELLGVSPVGVDDDFFELGGESLAGVQLAARLRNLFQISVPLQAVLEARTVAKLALLAEELVLAEIERAGGEGE